MVNVDYCYHKNIDSYLTHDTFLSNKTLSYKKYCNAIIIPPPHNYHGSGLGGEGVYFNGKLIDGTNFSKPDYKYSSNCLNGEVKNSDEKVIFLDFLIASGWGHSITDSLRRMWFIIEYINKGFFSDYVVVYGLVDKQVLHKNFIRLLNILGISINNFKLITVPTVFKEVIIPDPCFFENDGQKWYTKEYVSLINKVKNEYVISTEKPLKKLYFSYRKVSTKHQPIRQFGERKLERFFKKMGFSIIYPELLSLDEQLLLLANCSVFASSEGSISHNTLFLHDSATAIIIPRVSSRHTGYQDAINYASKCKVFYIDSTISAFVSKTSGASRGIFYYVSEQLMDFFALTNPDRKKFRQNNYRDFIRYVSYNLFFYKSSCSFTDDLFVKDLFFSVLYRKLYFPIRIPFFFIKLLVKYIFKH